MLLIYSNQILQKYLSYLQRIEDGKRILENKRMLAKAQETKYPSYAKDW